MVAQYIELGDHLGHALAALRDDAPAALHVTKVLRRQEQNGFAVSSEAADGRSCQFPLVRRNRMRTSIGNPITELRRSLPSGYGCWASRRLALPKAGAHRPIRSVLVVFEDVVGGRSRGLRAVGR